MSLISIDPESRKKLNPFSTKNGTFSFRNNTKNACKIGCFPETHSKAINDIGWRLLLENERITVDPSFESIVNRLPAIYITEFLQETRIDTILTAIQNVIKGFGDGKKLAEMIKGDGAQSHRAQFIQKALCDDRFYINKLNPDDNKDKNFSTVIEKNVGSTENLILSLVYNLQYRLMKKEIQNKYLLPFDSNIIYNTNGTDGWPNNSSGFGGTSSYSIIGKLLSFAGSQIRITTEPVWTGTTNVSGTNIDVSFNLFNDTLEKAVNNYTMIHNLFPNNLFMQYGFIQQAPSYYEIRIEGGRRIMLCSGQFQCNGKGVSRKVDFNENIIASAFQHNSGSLELNKEMEETIKSLVKNGLRIPDAYEVKLSFKSLLPDSFNDFLIQWYKDVEFENKATGTINPAWGCGKISDAIGGLFKKAEEIPETEPDPKDEKAQAAADKLVDQKLTEFLGPENK